jgi:hypothetical protein
MKRSVERKRTGACPIASQAIGDSLNKNSEARSHHHSQPIAVSLSELTRADFMAGFPVCRTLEDSILSKPTILIELIENLGGVMVGRLDDTAEQSYKMRS